MIIYILNWFSFSPNCVQFVLCHCSQCDVLLIQSVLWCTEIKYNTVQTLIGLQISWFKQPNKSHDQLLQSRNLPHLVQLSWRKKKERRFFFDIMPSAQQGTSAQLCRRKNILTHYKSIICFKDQLWSFYNFYYFLIDFKH